MYNMCVFTKKSTYVLVSVVLVPIAKALIILGQDVVV